MTQEKLNERFSWALSILDLRPSDKVLEIGCGAGILAEQICSRLTSGQLIAIDRSMPMIKKATQRNTLFVAHKKAEFVHTELADFKPGPYSFDKVMAFNVNGFWKDPVKELEIIQHCLLPDGRLYIFYQAPYDIDKSAANPFQKKLVENNYLIEQLIFKKMIPASAFCIIARPGS